jgi:nicotinamide-nucleotide adenylyltransferase
MDEAIDPDAHFGRMGLVSRFKPVHLGHAVMLESLAERCDLLRIGIGSSNRYGVRNPFTAEETARMIHLVLGEGDHDYEIVDVPDLDDGPRWRLMVRDIMGHLDVFVTANDYVRKLLAPDYPIVHPAGLIPVERHVPVDGTMVRQAMARGEEWKNLVPPAVAAYLRDRGLVERFRREFGLATLALEAPID